jgi:hypothetical protein
MLTVSPADRVSILAGAGVSAESGIPTFRGVAGLWRNYQIEEVASPLAWSRDPRLVREFYSMRRRVAAAAKPNPAHFALAKLEHALQDRLFVCTQNVDSLHEQAGSRNVVHMHGELLKSRCDSCSLPRLTTRISTNHRSPMPVRPLKTESVRSHRHPTTKNSDTLRFKTLEGGLMKTRLRSSFTITICALLIVNIALAQETLKQDNSTSVTIVTAADLSITRAADGKTVVSITFVQGRAKSGDTRITISGPYSLDVNGGVKEVKGPQGVELHVLSHEELRFEAPEIAVWEQSHKFSQNSACMKIPKFPGCGNPICDQPDHPEDQCRYNSGSGCSCVTPSGRPCSDTANPPQERKQN